MPNLGHSQKLKNKGPSAHTGAEKMIEQVKQGLEGVADARQGLSEMELTFKRDIKRRKLQVEESVFESNPTQPAPFRPRMSREPSGSVSRVDRPLLTPDADPCDADDKGWEATMGTEDEPPGAADRGAKRAPAINSDYLPLPWKGRLGYVGSLPFSNEGFCFGFLYAAG